MSEIQMTDEQRFGNASLSQDQVKALKHRYKMGSSLTNKEVEKLIETALFALGELEHQLRQEVM
jgi:hypothetical protein